MLKIETILVPTDFSTNSDHAFHLACALARDYHARLYVLHVFSPVPFAFVEGAAPIEPADWLRDARHMLQERYPEQPGVQVVRRLEQGHPTDEILRQANELKCELILMGTHGRSGLGRLLMGSVAETVIRQAPCPVLTVKTPTLGASPTAPQPRNGVLEPPLAQCS